MSEQKNNNDSDTRRGYENISVGVPNDNFKTILIFGLGIALGLAIAAVAGSGRKQGDW